MTPAVSVALVAADQAAMMDLVDPGAPGGPGAAPGMMAVMTAAFAVDA